MQAICDGRVPPDATPPYSPFPSDGSPCLIVPFGDSI